ncbi:unknown [Clostridium sp. CAG:354]|nr:unknown [Clostridium sp. CAG:354]
MNIRLILGILGGIVAVEFIAIIIQLRIYKREVDKSIEYENFRKEDVLIKVAKERRELREALAKQQELKEKMAELSKKREEARKTNGTK